jgi:hypothetical protein
MNQLILLAALTASTFTNPTADPAKASATLNPAPTSTPKDSTAKKYVLQYEPSVKAPGDHVQFGIRTYFDNKQSVDKWFPVKKNLKGFDFEAEGSHISKSKGDLKIDSDPIKIVNDKVRLIAMLDKDTAIRDTLQITLDYIANYQCKLQSNGDGHFLVGTADVYPDSIIHASLMKISILDSNAHKTYRYLVNTNGGTITISSKGGNGLDGNTGWDGLSGSSGSDGLTSVDVETTTDADGNPTTTTTTVQGPGGSGGRGGTGGSGGSGGNGTPSGNQGTNGMDGLPGSDGAAGSKGKITFVQSPPSN